MNKIQTEQRSKLTLILLRKETQNMLHPGRRKSKCEKVSFFRMNKPVPLIQKNTAVTFSFSNEC